SCLNPWISISNRAFSPHSDGDEAPSVSLNIKGDEGGTADTEIWRSFERLSTGFGGFCRGEAVISRRRSCFRGAERDPEEGA
ncbi:hypothetical protein SLEP1_g59513, partial [Rubroshorea leprosula]